MEADFTDLHMSKAPHPAGDLLKDLAGLHTLFQHKAGIWSTPFSIKGQQVARLGEVYPCTTRVSLVQCVSYRVDTIGVVFRWGIGPQTDFYFNPYFQSIPPDWGGRRSSALGFFPRLSGPCTTLLLRAA